MACPHERETRLCGKFRVMNLSRHYVYVCSGVINEIIFFIIYYGRVANVKIFQKIIFKISQI